MSLILKVYGSRVSVILGKNHSKTKITYAIFTKTTVTSFSLIAILCPITGIFPHKKKYIYFYVFNVNISIMFYFCLMGKKKYSLIQY